MRAAALVFAFAAMVAGSARADGEGAVELDLDAFTDHLESALVGEDDDVAVDAWEERLEPQAEDDWIAARGPREPEVDHPARTTRAVTVGLTVTVGDDLAITRLVFADSARTVAFVKHILLGHFDLPLGTGPTGRRLPGMQFLLEPRGRDLLIIRTSNAFPDRMLSARVAAWDAVGLETLTPVEGLVYVDPNLLALAWVDAARAHEWLADQDAELLIGVAHHGGRSKNVARAAAARDMARFLARAIGQPVEEER